MRALTFLAGGRSRSAGVALVLGLLALSPACADTQGPPSDGKSADGGSSDGATADGAGADGAADTTHFPAGPCAARNGDPQLLRLRGTVFTGDVVLPDGEVFVSAKTGKILCVGADCSASPGAAEATIVCTDGVITPGLIDPHNHANYNHLPRWKHTKRFQNRYQWQAEGSYKDFKKSQSATFAKAKCETMKWAELRAMVAGTTSMQGTSGSACIDGWVRDLDEDGQATGIAGYSIDTQVTKISGTSQSTAKSWAQGLKTGASAALVVHVAEGIDAASKEEWYDLVKLGLAVPGVSLIHAAGLTGVELAEAYANGVRLIWSPQSNLDLYGDTTRVPAALNLGIPVAIGPDWTPSGSMSQLEEMKCARQLSQKRWGGALTDERLVRMATVDAALTVGAQESLGRLGTGYLADIAVFSGDRSQPFAAVIAARPETVRLVLIGGRPLYGDKALIEAIVAQDCEPMEVCGAAKIVCMKDSKVDKGTQSVADIRSHLETTLASAKAADNPKSEFAYGYELFPLYECGAAADALINCDVGGGTAVPPSEADLDGDGKANSGDNCPKVFNPDQGNLDSDGQGDACDVCPLVDGATTCPKPGANDTDGDATPNDSDNCPQKANADQADTDKDGKGNVCDPCPSAANPGAEACPTVTASVIALNQDTKTIADGELVTLQGLVVTAVAAQKGSALPAIWAQLMPGVPHGGILLQLPKSTPVPVKVGDVITVSGKVATLFGLRALQEATPKVTSSGQPVEALVVAASTLAKAPGSAPYRSLLVQVEKVEVIEENADAASGKDFGEFLVTGGLRVDDTLLTWGTDFPHPKKGDAFAALRGVLTLSFGNDKLLPRSAQDFTK